LFRFFLSYSQYFLTNRNARLAGRALRAGGHAAAG
jgi:hypothetical protein